MGRRIHFKPAFLFGLEFLELLCGQGISQMECDEVSHRSLSPMGEIASMYLVLGFWIEEIHKVYNIINVCCVSI
jgi:hypothetical protein